MHRPAHHVRKVLTPLPPGQRANNALQGRTRVRLDRRHAHSVLSDHHRHQVHRRAHPVLSDHHRRQVHRPAHLVRKVLTPPRLEVLAINVINDIIRTRLEQLNAQSVCPQDQKRGGPKGQRAEPVNRGDILVKLLTSAIPAHWVCTAPCLERWLARDVHPGRLTRN